MGSSGSKEEPQQQIKEVVKYVESDESKRMRLLGQLENQLQQLKEEVKGVQPSISENVKETISQEQDALLLRYSQLKDKELVVQHIKEVFGKFPLLQFLVDTGWRHDFLGRNERNSSLAREKDGQACQRQSLWN